MTIYLIAFSYGKDRHVNWMSGYSDRLYALSVARSLNVDIDNLPDGHWYVAKCQVEPPRETVL